MSSGANLKEIQQLFKQIVDSEKKAEERRQHLLSVKDNIAKESEIHRMLKSDIDSLLGQIVIKTQFLNNKKLVTEWIRNKNVILQAQSADMEHQLTTLQDKVNQLEKECTEKHMAFTKAVDEFTSEYDLIQFSNHTRATTAYQKEQQLKLQDNKLREDISQYEDVCASVNAIESEISLLKSRLLAKEKLNIELEKEVGKNKKLEDRKQELLQLRENNDQHEKLQHTMQKHTCEKQLEQYHNYLQGEIHKLQEQIRESDARRKQQIERQHISTTDPPKAKRIKHNCIEDNQEECMDFVDVDFDIIDQLDDVFNDDMQPESVKIGISSKESS